LIAGNKGAVMKFIDGNIEGVIVEKLTAYRDQRGVLIETFREDNLPEGIKPAMSYMSWTEAGKSRGPHEHVHQTDIFAFAGPGIMKLYLWDNRKKSKTYLHRMVMEVGEKNPVLVFVPPFVVHGYKNTGNMSALVLNYPDKLYKGREKAEPVDEVRHEEGDNEFNRDFV
jgi:dTDP-4-dehydrorhamnose 3,5-epimerase